MKSETWSLLSNVCVFGQDHHLSETSGSLQALEHPAPAGGETEPICRLWLDGRAPQNLWGATVEFRTWLPSFRSQNGTGAQHHTEVLEEKDRGKQTQARSRAETLPPRKAWENSPQPLVSTSPGEVDPPSLPLSHLESQVSRGHLCPVAEQTFLFLTQCPLHHLHYLLCTRLENGQVLFLTWPGVEGHSP